MALWLGVFPTNHKRTITTMTYDASPRTDSGAAVLRAIAQNKDERPLPPTPEYHTLQLLALGTPYAVNSCRNRLYTLGYAQLIEWSPLLPITTSSDVVRAARPDEVMCILTKRIPLPPKV
ncbi:MAG: hypothetical protein WBA10_11130 [Elainellaceae cyanobacterium]